MDPIEQSAPAPKDDSIELLPILERLEDDEPVPGLEDVQAGVREAFDEVRDTYGEDAINE